MNRAVSAREFFDWGPGALPQAKLIIRAVGAGFLVDCGDCTFLAPKAPGHFSLGQRPRKKLFSPASAESANQAPTARHAGGFSIMPERHRSETNMVLAELKPRS